MDSFKILSIGFLTGILISHINFLWNSAIGFVIGVFTVKYCIEHNIDHEYIIKVAEPHVETIKQWLTSR